VSDNRLLSTVSFVTILTLQCEVPLAKELTTGDMDRIIARSEAHKSELQKFASIAQSVYYESIITNPSTSEERIISLAAGGDPFGDNNHWTSIGVDPSKTLESRLASAAERAAKDFDPAKVRGSWIDLGIGVGLSGTVLLSGHPELGLIAPPIHEVITRYADADAKTADFPQRFTADWVVWGLARCRDGGAGSKALAPFCNQLDEGVFIRNEKEHPAVKAAEAIGLAVKQNQKIDEALGHLQLSEDSAKALENDISYLADLTAEQLTDNDAATAIKKHRDDSIYNLQTVSGSLTVVAMGFRYGGDDHTANLVDKMAEATSGLANLAEKAEGMAPMMLAGSYLTIAQTVISAMQNTRSDNPYPILFNFLQSISRQIDALRNEMEQWFAHVDSEMTTLLGRQYALSLSQSQDLNQVIGALADINNKLMEIDKKISQQFQDLAQLTILQEDRKCFKWSGAGFFVPLDDQQFISCRQTYVDRNTKYARTELARNVSADQLVKTGFINYAFPYGGSYEELRKLLHAQETESKVSSANTVFDRNLANPDVWLNSANALIALIANNHKYFDEVLISDLNDIIAGGRDLESFINNAALQDEESGTSRSLRASTFENLVEQIFSTYGAVLARAEAELQAFPIALDGRGGAEQPINADGKFELLNKPVPMCVKSKAQAINFDNIYETSSGGGWTGDRIVSAKSMVPGAYKSWINNVFQPQLEGISNTLRFDKSFMLSLPHAPVLMEQIADRGAVLDVCFDKFQVSKFDQDLKTTKMHIEVEVMIFMTHGTQTGNVRDLVAVRSGHFDVVFPGAAVLYNTGKQAIYRYGELVSTAWKTLASKFGEMVPEKNQVADDNLGNLVKYLNDKIEGHRFEAQQKVEQASLPDSEIVSRDRRLLEALTLIGLAPNKKCVTDWLDVLRAEEMPDVNSLIDISMGSGGRPFDVLKKTIAVSKDRMKESIKHFEGCSGIQAPNTPLAATVIRLEQIKAAREIIAKRAGSNSTPPSHRNL
jgi:hypothetical protein